MRFASPYWLIFLFLIPALSLFYLRAVRKREESIGKFASSMLRSSLVSAPSGRRRWSSYILTLAGLFLIIIALAMPQLGQKPADMERKGLDIEFVIDASYSMAVSDVVPNRFEYAKTTASEIMKNLKGDRVGLTMFTNSTLGIVPFTTDYGAVDYFLKISDMKVFFSRGTNIETAVRNTVSVFDKKSWKSKVIVILSDGEDEPGLTYKLSDELSSFGLHVFVFGVGTEDGGRIPILLESEGNFVYMKDSSGAEILSKFDEAALNKIARAYNGKYYRYSPEGVKQFIKDLDALKKEQIENRENIVYNDYFQYFLLLGFVLVFIGKAVLEE
ncbi:MAG: VWA domain-containing protein [Nitrospinae bacterium]|nr:VWA domain-containing protein [Nitrospinota bacterium]